MGRCADPDVIRVGDTFYLVSTTMHLMPGAPVMASKDLKNWKTVSYIFDKLTDSPKYDLSFSLPLDQQKGEGVGTVYGRGQWATSLKFHNGKSGHCWPLMNRALWATPIYLPHRKRGTMDHPCTYAPFSRCHLVLR